MNAFESDLEALFPDVGGPVVLQVAVDGSRLIEYPDGHQEWTHDGLVLVGA